MNTEFFKIGWLCHCYNINSLVKIELDYFILTIHIMNT